MKSLKISGKDFIFSNYMSCVDQEDIDYHSDQFSKESLTAACGVDLKDNCLIVVSFLGEVMFIKPNGHLIPVRSEVILFGRAIRIYFSNGTEAIVESKIAISSADGQDVKSQLYINNSYLCDITSSEQDEN